MTLEQVIEYLLQEGESTGMSAPADSPTAPTAAAFKLMLDFLENRTQEVFILQEDIHCACVRPVRCCVSITGSVNLW